MYVLNNFVKYIKSRQSILSYLQFKRNMITQTYLNTKREAALFHTYLADPSRHGVCAGGAVVCVDDNHSDDDGSNDKDHSEKHVFADEWNSTGGGGDQLNNHQQEHSQREQDRDAEGHLLT